MRRTAAGWRFARPHTRLTLMASINITLLGGNLARDPELRYTPGGTAVVDFGIGVNRKWKTESGELKEEVSFFDCTAFGRTAENINEYFQKGSPILLEARLKQETWEDKTDGRKRSKVKLIVEKFHFVGSAKGEGKVERPPRKSRPAASETPPDDDGDDVPF